jgi:hypothetical protein
MNIIKTYTSAEYNTFDVIIDDTVVAYYYEHFIDFETGEKLENTIYEIYYDLNDGDFDSSLVTEDFDEIEDILDCIFE